MTMHHPGQRPFSVTSSMSLSEEAWEAMRKSWMRQAPGGAGKQPGKGPEASQEDLGETRTFTVKGKALRCRGFRIRLSMSLPDGGKVQTTGTTWLTDDEAVPVLSFGQVMSIVTSVAKEGKGLPATVEIRTELIDWGRGADSGPSLIGGPPQSERSSP